MYGPDDSRDPNVMYYITMYNEPMVQPEEPEDLDVEGVLKGIYKLSDGPELDGPKVQLLASGVAVPWIVEAQRQQLRMVQGPADLGRQQRPEAHRRRDQRACPQSQEFSVAQRLSPECRKSPDSIGEHKELHHQHHPDAQRRHHQHVFVHLHFVAPLKSIARRPRQRKRHCPPQSLFAPAPPSHAEAPAHKASSSSASRHGAKRRMVTWAPVASAAA